MCARTCGCVRVYAPVCLSMSVYVCAFIYCVSTHALLVCALAYTCMPCASTYISAYVYMYIICMGGGGVECGEWGMDCGV